MNYTRSKFSGEIAVSVITFLRCRISHALVNVNIAGESFRDTAPTFALSDYSIYVKESASSGEVIANLHAINKIGVPMDLTYTLAKIRHSQDSLDPTGADVIKILPSGELQLVGSLDYERRTNYSYTVTAVDRSRRSAVTTLKLMVVPVDEFPPICTENVFHFQVRLI